MESISFGRLSLPSAIGNGDTHYFREKSDANGVRTIQTVLNRGVIMREEYDFSGAERNPYAKKLKKQITINIDSGTIEFFKEQASETGIPYQTLINLYLADCVKQNRKLNISWT